MYATHQCVEALHRKEIIHATLHSPLSPATQGYSRFGSRKLPCQSNNLLFLHSCDCSHLFRSIVLAQQPSELIEAVRIIAYKGTIVTSLTDDYLGKTQSKCRLCTWSNSHPFIGLGSTQRTSRLHLDDLGAISLGIAPPTTKCHHHAIGRTPAFDVATAKTYDHFGVFQVIAESTAVSLANKQPQRFCVSRSRHHHVVRRAVSVEKTSEEFGDSALAFTAHTDKAFGFLPHAA